VLTIDPKTADAAVRAELDNFLRDNPNDPVALVRLAQLQQRNGSADEAIKTYEKVVDKYPQFPAATRQLALLYVQSAPDDQKAYDLVAKARLANPGDAELAKTLGILSYRRGTYPRSLELLQEAAAKRKDDPELQYYLGMTYYRLKQFTEAKEVLQSALASKLLPEQADEAKRALADCCQDPDQN
jgi:Flp pilus assembly protein TadD